MAFFPVFKRKKKNEGKRVRNVADERTDCIENIDEDVVFEPPSAAGEKKVPKFWFDKMCLVAFPTLYIIFNVSYWSYYA